MMEKSSEKGLNYLPHLLEPSPLNMAPTNNGSRHCSLKQESCHSLVLSAKLCGAFYHGAYENDQGATVTKAFYKGKYDADDNVMCNALQRSQLQHNRSRQNLSYNQLDAGDICEQVDDGANQRNMRNELIYPENNDGYVNEMLEHRIQLKNVQRKYQHYENEQINCVPALVYDRDESDCYSSGDNSSARKRMMVAPMGKKWVTSKWNRHQSEDNVVQQPAADNVYVSASNVSVNGKVWTVCRVTGSLLFALMLLMTSICQNYVKYSSGRLIRRIIFTLRSCAFRMLWIVTTAKCGDVLLFGLLLFFMPLLFVVGCIGFMLSVCFATADCMRRVSNFVRCFLF